MSKYQRRAAVTADIVGKKLRNSTSKRVGQELTGYAAAPGGDRT